MARTTAHFCCLALAATTVVASASTLKLDFTRERTTTRELFARADGALPVALPESSEQNNYHVSLSVGTPPQNFKLILDTGSSDLWVPAANDTVCEQDQDSCVFGTYKSSASSTYKLVDAGAFFIGYGDGSNNTGDYISDVVELGGVTLKDVTLGLATDGSSVIPGETAQGLIGVGYRALSSSNGTYFTIVDSLFNAGVINRRAFSLYLNDMASGEGSIIFGGVDSDKYTGDLVAVPIKTETINGQQKYLRYLVDLTSVSFNGGSGAGKSLGSPSMADPALLDSGTTEIIIDQEIFNNVVAGLGAVPVNGGDGENLYATSCAYTKSKASLAFQFGGPSGPTINVPISELLEDLGGAFGDGDEACLLLMRPTSADNPSVILGDSFLRSAYVFYDQDNNEIALAQANFNATGSNVQAVPSGSGIPGVSSTATAAATQYTYDNAPALETGFETAIVSAPAISAAASTLPLMPLSPTFSLGVAEPTTGTPSPTAGGNGGGAAATSTSAGSASHAGLVASTPLGMKHVGALVSLAAFFFAGMLVL